MDVERLKDYDPETLLTLAEIVREREESRAWTNNEELLARIHDTIQTVLSWQIAQATAGKHQYKPVRIPRPGEGATDGKRRVSPRELAMMMRGA